MSSISYTHYNYQIVNSQKEYEDLYLKYESDSNLHLTIREKTINIVRDLGIFETISAFFALLWDSFCACFVAKPELEAQRIEAWKSLYNREWIKIIALEEEVSLGELPEPKMLPELPLETNFLILADFNIPMLGLASQVCKLWQMACGQDKLWKNFFPFFKFPEGIKIKNYCSTRYINSESQVIDRVASFVDGFKANECKRLRFYPCISSDSEPNSIDSFISLKCMSREEYFLQNVGGREYVDQVLFLKNIPLEGKPLERAVNEEVGNRCRISDFSNIPKVLMDGFKLDYYIMQSYSDL